MSCRPSCRVGALLLRALKGTPFSPQFLGAACLAGGTYTLSIYLHEALNRSAWNHAGDPPLADPQGEEEPRVHVEEKRFGAEVQAYSRCFWGPGPLIISPYERL